MTLANAAERSAGQAMDGLRNSSRDPTRKCLPRWVSQSPKPDTAVQSPMTRLAAE